VTLAACRSVVRTVVIEVKGLRDHMAWLWRHPFMVAWIGAQLSVVGYLLWLTE
jgi:hypothetical protein